MSSHSFADVIAAIESAADVPDDKAALWPCALRRLAEGLGRPPELVPIHGGEVWERIERLKAVHLQCLPKTLANYKSAAKAALRWFDHQTLAPSARRTAAG